MELYCAFTDLIPHFQTQYNICFADQGYLFFFFFISIVNLCCLFNSLFCLLSLVFSCLCLLSLSFFLPVSLWRSCLQFHFSLMLASFLLSILDMGACMFTPTHKTISFFTCACLIKYGINIMENWKKKLEIKLFSIHPAWQPARLCRSGCTRCIRCQIALPRTRTCVVEYIAEYSTPIQALPSKRQTRPGVQDINIGLKYVMSNGSSGSYFTSASFAWKFDTFVSHGKS